MIRIFLLLFIILFNIPVNAGDNINSLHIIAATAEGMLNGNCLKYKWTFHTCVWGSLLVGKNFTPVIDHYLPDLIVVVYPKPGTNPWTEANYSFDSVGEIADNKIVSNKEDKYVPAGYGNQTFINKQDQSIKFKEADVIGNPALVGLSKLTSFILLPTTVDTEELLPPYYLSLVDSELWRGLPPRSLAEETAALGLAQSHRVGSGLINWGGVYPHEGKVIGFDDYKISSVIAQRAADIVTNSNPFGHIRRNLSNHCGQQCKAKSIAENSSDTYFQLIYPISKNNDKNTQCFQLGDEKSYESEEVSPAGTYIWIVWRHYQGCADGDGIYLGTI